MGLEQACRSAHKLIFAQLPHKTVEIDGVEQIAYIETRNYELERVDGGYDNMQDLVCHILTSKPFKLNMKAVIDGRRYKIASMQSNAVYQTLTLRKNLYDND